MPSSSLLAGVEVRGFLERGGALIVDRDEGRRRIQYNGSRMMLRLFSEYIYGNVRLSSIAK